jgi:SAM-dependent methyltransferase
MSAAVPVSRLASSRPPSARSSASSPIRGWLLSGEHAGSAGRRFDAVVAAQSWHGVDPVRGVAKAARVLRPGGRLALFGHVFEPPAEIAEAFSAAYRRLVPDSPFNSHPERRGLDLYQAMYAKFADKIRDTDGFSEPRRWRFDWEATYTRDHWLDVLATTGGLTQVSPDQLAEVLEVVGAVIDSIGGRFTMPYTTVATTAAREDPA